MIAVLVDKMIRTQIVDCAAVANWLFSQDMAHEFTRCVWGGKTALGWDRFQSKFNTNLFSFFLNAISFLFSSFRLFIWEILHSTIRKMDKHVQKIQQELEGAKDKLEKQQHKRVNYIPSPSWSRQEVAIKRIYWLK